MQLFHMEIFSVVSTHFMTLCFFLAVCMQPALLRNWFHVGRWNTSGQIGSSKPLYSGLSPPFSWTLWRTLLEFLILWRRPSCPGPYKNLFHEVHNLTDQRTYCCPVRTILTFSCVPWPFITSSNHNYFKRRLLCFPWLCKWRYFWWRMWKD